MQQNNKPTKITVLQKSESNNIELLQKSSKNQLQQQLSNDHNNFEIIKVSSVLVVAGMDDNKVVLLGIRSKDGKLSLPGGHKQPSENEIECAARELQEETQLEVKTERFYQLKTETHNSEDNSKLCVNFCFCTEFVDIPKVSSAADPDQEFTGLFWSPIIDGCIDPKLIPLLVENQKTTIQLIRCVPSVKKQLMTINPVVKVNGMWLRKSKNSNETTDIWKVLHKSSNNTATIRIEKKQNNEKEVVDSVKYHDQPIFNTHNIKNIKAGKWLDTDNMSALLLALSSHYKNLSINDKYVGSSHILKKSISSNNVRTPGQTISTKNTYLVLEKSTPTEKNEILSNWAVYMKNGEKVGDIDALHKKGKNNLALVYRSFQIPDEVPKVNKDPEQSTENNLQTTFKKLGVKNHIPEITKGLMHWYIKDDASFIEAAKKKTEKLEKCMSFFPMSKTEKLRTQLNKLKDALREINKMRENQGKENIFEDLKPMSAIAAFKQKWFHIITSDINAGSRDKKINITKSEADQYENDRKKLLEHCSEVLPKEVFPAPIQYLANVIEKR